MDECGLPSESRDYNGSIVPGPVAKQVQIDLANRALPENFEAGIDRIRRPVQPSPLRQRPRHRPVPDRPAIAFFRSASARLAVADPERGVRRIDEHQVKRPASARQPGQGINHKRPARNLRRAMWRSDLSPEIWSASGRDFFDQRDLGCPARRRLQPERARLTWRNRSTQHRSSYPGSDPVEQRFGAPDHWFGRRPG